MFDGIDMSKLNLGDMMNKMNQMAEEVKVKNSKLSFSSEVGGGLVKLSINGNSEVIDLQIDDSLLSNKDSLKTFLISAMNDVIKQSDENKKKMATNVMSGMGSFAK